MWIGYEPRLDWDRYLIEYRVDDLSPAEKEYEPDSKKQHWDFADVGDFGDGKDLVLKANFVITNLTHKKPCAKEKEIEHNNKFKEGSMLFGKDIDKRTTFTIKVKKGEDGELEIKDFKENKENKKK